MSQNSASSKKTTDTAVEEPKLTTVPAQATGEDETTEETVTTKLGRLTALLKAKKHIVAGVGAAAAVATVAFIGYRKGQQPVEDETVEPTDEA
ncbi:hypothetical protein SEA_ROSAASANTEWAA_31 [Streptomyces phage RosaAsantewaa]|nr:hypothetical protein SEA_ROSAASANTEWAA_31 [Streptomyces phage RosaAsantewaa]